MAQFNQLAQIKSFREDKALRAVAAQRGVLARAVQDQDTARRRLDEYRAWAGQQEQRIYKDLCERVVRVHNLQDVQAQMQSLRDRVARHEDEAVAAEKRRGQEEKQLDADRGAHRQARRIHDKFADLAQVFARQEQDGVERLEEAGIEEAVELRRTGAPAWESIA